MWRARRVNVKYLMTATIKITVWFNNRCAQKWDGFLKKKLNDKKDDYATVLLVSLMGSYLVSSSFSFYDWLIFGFFNRKKNKFGRNKNGIKDPDSARDEVPSVDSALKSHHE